MKQTAMQFMRFAAVGVVNTAIDSGGYVLLTRNIAFFSEKFWLASVITFCIATLNSFLLNKTWTFKNQRTDWLKQYSQFLLVSLVGLGLHSLGFWALVSYGGVNDIVGKCIVIVIGMGWNFFANRYWTFQETNQLAGDL